MTDYGEIVRQQANLGIFRARTFFQLDTTGWCLAFVCVLMFLYRQYYQKSQKQKFLRRCVDAAPQTLGVALIYKSTDGGSKKLVEEMATHPIAVTPGAKLLTVYDVDQRERAGTRIGHAKVCNLLRELVCEKGVGVVVVALDEPAKLITQVKDISPKIRIISSCVNTGGELKPQFQINWKELAFMSHPMFARVEARITQLGGIKKMALCFHKGYLGPSISENAVTVIQHALARKFGVEPGAIPLGVSPSKRLYATSICAFECKLGSVVCEGFASPDVHHCIRVSREDTGRSWSEQAYGTGGNSCSDYAMSVLAKS